MGSIKIPGLIDPHVHLRVPGGEQKEDFCTGTRAALAGGFTTLLAMPNTNPPLVSLKAFRVAQNLSQKQSLCDVFLYAGAAEGFVSELPALAQEAIGLKIYMNQTFGDLRLTSLSALTQVVAAWPRNKPICFHAEGESIAAALGLAASFKRSVHICHVSRRDEIELIAQAKASGLQVTCEVTPHHLFLTEADARELGPFGDMRPLLASQADQDALWEAIASGVVDCIGSDHAPHTIWEKLGYLSEAEWQLAISTGEDQGRDCFANEARNDGNKKPGELRESGSDLPYENQQEGRDCFVARAPRNDGTKKPSPPGVPALESTLPLMLSAVTAGRLSLERVIELMYHNPRRIFNLPEQKETWVELDLDARYTFPDHPLYTKCGWSPFEGQQMQGKVLRTIYKGRLAYSDGQIIEN
jgi:carbamoyl-phosphate synthase/aspartate carbamoyltransferase/dihydroorotase